MNIFGLDHIFVTFAPGAGGNFIAGLLDKINSGNLTELSVSISGSSHVVNNGKIDGRDSISFGSNPEENSVFLSIEDREIYYLDRIKKEYSVPTKTITWTHDFTNLPLYKKHFTNCRTLTISTYDVTEKLISNMMHINKVILSDESDIPIPKELWEQLKIRLKNRIATKLETILGKPVDIDHIFDNRCNDYRDLIFYFSSISLLEYSGLHDVLALIGYPSNPNLPTRNANIREIVSNNTDVILPYRYLVNNNVELLQDAVSTVFNRPLNNIEKDFIQITFDAYRAKQNTELLTNPLEYFNERKSKAIDIIKKIKAGLL
jgi:hypothetical protein